MKLDIVCKVTNGKGAVEKHGPNPNPVFDAKITVGLTNEQMIELYGAGSEEAVSRYWDKNGNPNLGMTGTRKENDSFQIKDVEVTCQGVTIESCTISSITVEPEKGYIAAVAFNIRGPWHDDWTNMVKSGLVNSVNGTMRMVLSGKQINLALEKKKRGRPKKEDKASDDMLADENAATEGVEDKAAAEKSTKKPAKKKFTAAEKQQREDKADKKLNAARAKIIAGIKAPPHGLLDKDTWLDVQTRLLDDRLDALTPEGDNDFQLLLPTCVVIFGLNHESKPDLVAWESLDRQEFNDLPTQDAKVKRRIADGFVKWLEGDEPAEDDDIPEDEDERELDTEGAD